MTHDEEFKPSFVGSAVFLYSIVSQNCIFWFNYGVTTLHHEP